MPESPWLDLQSLAAGAARSIRSWIGPDAVLEGNLVCVTEQRDERADIISIGGTLRGNVCGYDVVIIAPTGNVQSDISANTVVVNGRLKGRVNAPRRVEFKPHARFYGELNPMPDLLVISPSAVFGRDERHTNPLADK